MESWNRERFAVAKWSGLGFVICAGVVMLLQFASLALFFNHEKVGLPERPIQDIIGHVGGGIALAGGCLLILSVISFIGESVVRLFMDRDESQKPPAD